jgi:uncharacterized Rossmann fold enzyme
MNEPKSIVNAETEKLEVKYCIPDWLRDEQIKMSCLRFPKRIQPLKELNTEPIALVCFGPTLNETWEEIKKFKYVISCSGSHKFLIEKGIIPTWHVEVDPRIHKIKLIGDDIRTETEFMMASCCHPKVFDHLVKHGANITLWHTYSGEKKANIPLVFPRGDWILTGGSNVGLRALVIARFLGFINIHIFGMDGSFPKDGNKHAAEHPNQCKGYITAILDDVEYYTTTAFLTCAQQTFHELSMLPDVNLHFYGDALIQRMAMKKLKDKMLVKKDKVKIAFLSQPTITPEYIIQNRLLHETNAAYGTSVLRHKDTIIKLYQTTKATSLLDYGCGKGLLAKNLEFPIWEYDPAIPGKDKAPRSADLLVCVDVLEHVEPELLDSTLRDLARCTIKVGYIVIATYPSQKTLPDGRNTHLIQQGKDWWVETLRKHFIIPDNGIFEVKSELHIIVSPKEKSNSCQNYTIQLPKEEVCVC